MRAGGEMGENYVLAKIFSYMYKLYYYDIVYMYGTTYMYMYLHVQEYTEVNGS